MIINVPREEVKDVADRTYFNPEFGFYETGLDVYHTLHCVVCLSGPECTRA